MQDHQKQEEFQDGHRWEQDKQEHQHPLFVQKKQPFEEK
jgi:hypothetical protein